MAFVLSLLTRRSKGFSVSISSLYWRPNSCWISRLYSPIEFFSTSSNAKTTPFDLSTKHHFQNSALFCSNPEKSDSDSDFEEPTGCYDDPELRSLLGVVCECKSRSLSRVKALEFIRAGFGSQPTKDLVCRALWELRRDWKSALVVFRWGYECVFECPWAWRLMIWVLGKNGRFEFSWRMVRMMHRGSILTSDAMVVLMERWKFSALRLCVRNIAFLNDLYILIDEVIQKRRYAAANESCKAIKTFHAMDKFKIHANTAAFYALLRALCKHSNVEEAEELLFCSKKFYPLETESFNIILDGWCNIIVDIVEARRIWREMSSCCIKPDGTSYAHMICCFSKVGNLFESVRLYDEMKKRGWVPNLAIYNALISVLTRENCFKEAQKLFSKIVEEGMEADVKTYNSMVLSLSETHQLEEAHKIMHAMIEKGFMPTLETYHALLKVEDIEGTWSLIKKMRDVGCGPNADTFLIVICKFFRMNQCEHALRMWSEMKQYNVTPDSSHCLEMVQGLTKHGWIPKAMEFYNEMKCKGFHGDPKLEKIFQDYRMDHKNHWSRGKEYITRSHEKNKRPERL